MAESLPEDPRWKRRGCAAVAVILLMFVLLLIAISSGWLGSVDRGKGSHIVPIATNQS